MNEDEKEAERIRAFAASVFFEMGFSLKCEDSVRDIVKRHGDHPAFKAYMREMGLEDKLARFVGRKVLYE